jgi:hypothetical protein
LGERDQLLEKGVDALRVAVERCVVEELEDRLQGDVGQGDRLLHGEAGPLGARPSEELCKSGGAGP